MKYALGDRVKLNVEKNYEDGTKIPAGTCGEVIKVYPNSISYRIQFDGFEKTRRVLERDLDPC